MIDELNIIPQEGFQQDFLSNSADIIVAGSGAGVGKTWSLLTDAIRYKDVKNYGGVIFRRTTPQIRNEGGLLDASKEIYPHLGGVVTESNLTWRFPNDVKIKFSHLEYEKNVIDWQGSEVPYIGFDEGTHFSRKMIFYLLSRNRTTCGVKPCMRITCNPDPDSWLASFIAWWIDQETGYPIPERQGKIRWLFLDGESEIWGDTSHEVVGKAWHILEPIVEKSGIDPADMLKSVSFIAGDIYQNKALLDKDPSYLANLLAQDEQTRAQLLGGNWKVKINEDELIDYYAFKDAFTNTQVPTGEKYIIEDIAMQGADKFISAVFDGWRLVDIEIMDKSNGKEIIEVGKVQKDEHKVANRNIVYDSDGVGNFVGGFIPNSRAFHGGAKPVDVVVNGEKEKENYQNLKTQCYYKLGAHIKANGLFISEKVASMMYNDKKTVKQQFMHERKAIKKFKSGHDGKLKILPKERMKIIIGCSPDLMDVLMMRMYADISKPKNQQWEAYV